MNSTGTLYFFCGKMASGKSTLAAQIAAEKDALLLSEDQFLAELYPHEITDVPAYIERARRVGATVKPIVEALLRRGLSVRRSVQTTTGTASARQSGATGD